MIPFFHKRSGTTSKGTEYENVTIAKIVLTLISDKNIKNFHISSNNEEFGAFDDIVIEVDSENNNEVYAFQLKHSDRRNLASERLKSKKGDFSISKYFSSFQNMTNKTPKLVLFTNLEFNVPNSIQFQLEDEDFCVEMFRSTPNNILQILDQTGYCYKFRVIEDSSCVKIQEYKIFFENFFLYVNQDNLTRAKISTANLFKTKFLSDDLEVDCYLKFITEWSMKESKKEKLNKTWMQRAIALQLLSSRLKPIGFNPVNEKMKILREAISQFDITVFEQKSYDEVKKLWGDAKNDLKDIKYVNRIIRNYQIYPTFIDNLDNIHDTVLSKVLWLADKCPLIVEKDETVERAIELCLADKFILLGENLSDNWRENRFIFKDLADLGIKSVVYEKIVENFSCTLQQKEELSLKALGVDNKDILKLIKTDYLLEMLSSSLNIGGEKENLPFPYIERVLLKPVIDLKFLEKLDKNCLIIIYNVDTADTLKLKLVHQHFITCDSFLNKIDTYEDDFENNLQTATSKENINLKKCNIVVTKNEYSEDYLQKICKNFKWTKNYHQFKLTDDENLQWLQSKDKISDLENYRLSEVLFVSVQEHTLWKETPHNINLIISDPGMGKTELLKNFLNNCSAKFWTVLINSNDINEFLQQKFKKRDVDAFEQFIFECKYKNLNKLDKELLKLRIKHNAVFLMWDALDEISNDHLESATNLILQFSEKKIVQFVTSRCHLKKYLETKFNVLSMSMKQFNEEEQVSYIENRLGDSVKDVRGIISKIKNSFAIVEHKNILGIPLQLFMLTMLFRQDKEKYVNLLYDTFVLTDLYHWFIDEKYKVYYEEKLGVNVQNTELKIQRNFFKLKTLECYEAFALKTLFPEEFLKKLGVDFDKDFRTMQENNPAIGLIADFTDQIPRFLHSSFAEYLAAVYFSKNLNLKNTIAEVIFDEKYTNVRFFFDLLLAKKSTPHIAVLYKNYKLLGKCGCETETSKDQGGRTALHIACSWGTRYPRLNVKKTKKSLIIDDSNVSRVNKEETDYLRIINYLSKKCDLEQDTLYGMTPISYAQKCNCFITLFEIVKNSNVPLRKICDETEVANILYYSAMFGYDGVIDLFKSSAFPFVETKNNKRSLLHMSVNHNFSRKLFQVQSYRNSLNTGDNRKKTPLYLASETGNEETLKLLISQNAGVNATDTSGFTPLCVASWNGHEEIVKLLTASGGDVNLATKNGLTPLFVASERGHGDIVQILTARGADLNVTNRNGVTPLFIASEQGHEHIVRFLTACGADVNIPDKNGVSPLHVASERGHEKIVGFLRVAGSSVNIADDNGFTPLYAASKRGHKKIVEMLTSSGASINLPNEDGFTPLYIASHNGHQEIVEFLTASGAEVNLVNKLDFTPLYVASRQGHRRIVELLIKSGARVNLSNKDGFTPLYAASQQGHEEVVKFLTAFGAEVNFASEEGFTPLYTASQRGRRKIVEFLLASGARVNHASKDGFTPIYIASRQGHSEIVELLVKSDANVNLANKDGFTPLYTASHQGHENIVECIVANGAEVNHADKDGFTALHIAAQQGHEKIVGVLTKSGANINLVDKNGFTPLHIASQNGHIEIAEFLEGLGANLAYENSKCTIL